jgi:threonine aldolase
VGSVAPPQVALEQRDELRGDEPALGRQLQRDWRFYTWDEATGEVRLVCSWDTTADEVDAFAADVSRACEAALTA